MKRREHERQGERAEESYAWDSVRLLHGVATVGGVENVLDVVRDHSVLPCTTYQAPQHMASTTAHTRARFPLTCRSPAADTPTERQNNATPMTSRISVHPTSGQGGSG